MLLECGERYFSDKADILKVVTSPLSAGWGSGRVGINLGVDPHLQQGWKWAVELAGLRFTRRL